MDDLMLVLATCLVTATVIAAVEYYRQLRRAQREYEKAREAVEDIVMSFNRQFRSEGEKLEALAYKIEASGSKTSGILEIAQDTGKRMDSVQTKLEAEAGSMVKVTTRLEELEKRTRDLATSQESVSARLGDVEQRSRQLPLVPEAGLEAVIPLRRDKTLSQLTNTELSVLEMLATEGPKTAPEIKERVRLSREHTARLMKKLYEEGYLERETGKLPFKYCVKKEMEKILKKTEMPST